MIELADLLRWFPDAKAVRVVIDDDPSNWQAAGEVLCLCRNAGVAVSIEGLPPGIDLQELTFEELATLVRATGTTAH